MAMVNTFGMTVQCTRVCGSRTKLMEEESTFGPMAESTTESGKITICMAKVSTPGRTEECIKANTRTTASTAMEPTHGMTASNMLVGGKMESNTEKALIEKTDVIARVSGKMARELDG